MSFSILPQEFHVLADHYVIRTRVPMSELTESMILVRVKNGNLSAGDKITVQCMDHAYETLLHEAEFRVVSRTDALVTKTINDRETMQVQESIFMVSPRGEWWTSPAASEEKASAGKRSKAA